MMSAVWQIAKWVPLHVLSIRGELRPTHRAISSDAKELNVHLQVARLFQALTACYRHF